MFFCVQSSFAFMYVGKLIFFFLVIQGTKMPGAAGDTLHSRDMPSAGYGCGYDYSYGYVWAYFSYKTCPKQWSRQCIVVCMILEKHTCIHTRIHIYTNVNTPTFCTVCISLYSSIHMHMYIHICVKIHAKCTCKYAYMYMCTVVHVYSYTNSPNSLLIVTFFPVCASHLPTIFASTLNDLLMSMTCVSIYGMYACMHVCVCVCWLR